jgi:hypothetical protein
MQEVFIVYLISLALIALLSVIAYRLNPYVFQKRSIPFLILNALIPGANVLILLLMIIVVLFLATDKTS